jgi:glycosyltransferase involved in cell wall biosynthesis
VRELIADGESGLLAPGVDDPGRLADALAALMDDPESRRILGRHATAAMRAYRPDAVYERWALFLERCARGTRPDFGDLP